RRVHAGAFVEQKGNALRAGVERSQNERRVALRVAGVHVRAVVEQLANDLRVRFSDRRDQISRNRPGLTLVAGPNRWRRSRWGLGPTPEQKDRDPATCDQDDRHSNARETLVTFPTMHEATPTQDGEMSGPRQRLDYAA